VAQRVTSQELACTALLQTPNTQQPRQQLLATAAATCDSSDW
jgi:hypothetical protein